MLTVESDQIPTPADYAMRVSHTQTHKPFGAAFYFHLCDAPAAVLDTISPAHLTSLLN